MHKIKKYSLIFGICLVLGAGAAWLMPVIGDGEPVDNAGLYIALSMVMATAQPTVKRQLKSYLNRRKHHQSH